MWVLGGATYYFYLKLQVSTVTLMITHMDHQNRAKPDSRLGCKFIHCEIGHAGTCVSCRLGWLLEHLDIPAYCSRYELSSYYLTVNAHATIVMSHFLCLGWLRPPTFEVGGSSPLSPPVLLPVRNVNSHVCATLCVSAAKLASGCWVLAKSANPFGNFLHHLVLYKCFRADYNPQVWSACFRKWCEHQFPKKLFHFSQVPFLCYKPSLTGIPIISISRATRPKTVPPILKGSNASCSRCTISIPELFSIWNAALLVD